MPRCLLDTDLLNLYLVAPEQAPDPSVHTRVLRLFPRAAAAELALVVTPVTVSETSLVPDGLEVPPREAARTLEGVLALPGIGCEEERHVLYALSRYSR